jgi:hypothetical protein
MPATPPRGRPWTPRAPPQIFMSVRSLVHSLPRSLPFLRRNRAGAPLATARPHLHRRVPTPVNHHRSIARARSSATLFPPPNGRHHPLARSGRAPFLRPRCATTTGPLSSRSAHRLPRSLSIPLSPSLEFAISSRTLCARSLVGSWPEMAVGRRPPPRRRGPERRRGRPCSPPSVSTGPPPCGPCLRVGRLAFFAHTRDQAENGHGPAQCQQ